MKVLVVEPGYAPYEKDIVGLHGMQEVVGGTITAIYPFAEPVAVVGNDDSISLGMPFNRSMENGYGGVFGPFFVCALEEDHFGSLTPRQMETYKKNFTWPNCCSVQRAIRRSHSRSSRGKRCRRLTETKGQRNGSGEARLRPPPSSI